MSTIYGFSQSSILSGWLARKDWGEVPISKTKIRVECLGL